MSKISKHNLQMQIDTLKGFRVSMQAEINRMKEWISDIEKGQTQPNVTLPKSTRYDAEVGSRLDSLDARINMVEGMLKKDPEPEPQNIRKVVFVWRITEDGKLKRPVSEPNEFDKIEELFQLGDKAILFLAHFGQGASVNIYIGHYE
jgi:hypothetical protein